MVVKLNNTAMLKTKMYFYFFLFTTTIQSRNSADMRLMNSVVCDIIYGEVTFSTCVIPLNINHPIFTFNFGQNCA